MRAQILAAGLAIALAVQASPVSACPVCIDLPEKTLADRVLEDRYLVLARPDPSNAFTYRPTSVLKGPGQTAETLPSIPIIVDTVARRRLGADPDLSVLLSYDGERWHRLAYATPDMQSVVFGMLENGSDWTLGGTEDPERFDFFANLHTHPDRSIQTLSLMEIARAPYSLIRTLPVTLPSDDLRRKLTDINQIPYAAISILLLGLSEDPEIHAYVRRKFESALSSNQRLIGAWAVAATEVDSEAAIDAIAARLERNLASDDARAALVTALIVSASAEDVLRPAVTPILADILRSHPQHMSEIAYAMLDWKDWSLVPSFEARLSLDPTMDPATRYIVQMVIDTAKDTAPSASIEGG